MPMKPSSPAALHRSSIFSSIASPTKTNACTGLAYSWRAGLAPCRSGCGRRGNRCASSDRRVSRCQRPSRKRGIRQTRENRGAEYRARRPSRPRGTCRPAARRRYPRSVAGSWWHQARRSAGRACLRRRRGRASAPSARRRRSPAARRPAPGSHEAILLMAAVYTDLGAFGGPARCVKSTMIGGLSRSRRGLAAAGP